MGMSPDRGAQRADAVSCDRDAARRLHLPGRVVDLAAGTLCDSAGRPIPLRPQAWSVLELLARHAGQVITKERLLQVVWPGLLVTDSSVVQAVKDVRSALGACGRDVIKTVSRRGYLLVSDIPRSRDVVDPLALPLLPPLPRLAWPLYGRSDEMETLGQLIAAHRLVTVLGAGGIGKTVVAVAAARRRVDLDAGLVAWADLASIAEPALLPATIARSLALPVSPGEDPLQGLLAALTSTTALLVLDNAEHLIEAVAAFASRALASSPGLRLLVTSQVPLHLEEERLLRLSALGVPRPDEAIDTAAGAPAVAMFVDRARAVDNGFELTVENLPAVVRICRRLDGLPLALRLAAGRVHLLGLSGLESHLNDRFRWLAAPTRDAPTRQQTLTATLDWSYNLLAASEQRLFRWLGVCVGSFSIELVLRFYGHSLDDDANVIAELAGLVERSLVGIAPGEPARYRLLETPREHALRQLERAGEIDEARLRHARAMSGAFEAASESAWTTHDEAWLARWAPDLDNLRAALKWSAKHDGVLCTALIAGAGCLFRLLDLRYELARQADALEAAVVEELEDSLAARFWLARCSLESGRSGLKVHGWARRAERHARAARGRRELYLALCQRAANALMEADSADALLAEVTELESPDWPPQLRCHRLMALFARESVRNRWPQALDAAQQGIELAIEAGATLLTSIFATWSVVALLGLGDLQRARQRSRAVRPLVMQGPTSMVIRYVGTCARIALKQGEFDAVRIDLAAMFDLSRSVQWTNFEVFGDLYFGLALAEGRSASAARLLGYALVASEQAWGVRKPSRAREAATATLANILGSAQLEQMSAEGARLGPEAVCGLTLEPRAGLR